MGDEKNKVYVGNLEYGLAENELGQAFEAKGLKVKEAKIIKDKYTGRSKGFGFVSFETSEDVNKAIESMDGQDLKGRKLKVSAANPPSPREDRGNSGFSRGMRQSY